MDLSPLYLVAGILVVIVVALVEVAKKTFPALPAKYLPLLSVGLGLVAGFILYPFSDYDLYTTLVAGLVAGLVASGTFDLTKVVK